MECTGTTSCLPTWWTMILEVMYARLHPLFNRLPCSLILLGWTCLVSGNSWLVGLFDFMCVYIITAPASIVNSPDNTTANMSTNIHLTCSVMASHEVTLTWSRDGVTFIDPRAALVVISQSQVNSTYHTSSLTIPDVQLSHDGRYACHASNRFSSDGPSASDNSPDFYLFVQSE